ncbi:MAG: exodeoxyribonuclease VII small subunit [Deltaproteobacteria bacterium]|nr:exodeoxyribonuclease VII small subunit [Deltaproteobacteria bacterium]MBW2673589.1 exodeoxyribonuclease VII small subunit [Deltaproteobacteria bacterium]
MSKKKFEKALEQLEEIVKKMEEGNLSLDESLAAFEEGIRLSRFCADRLDEAERKVDVLLREDDTLQIKPFREGGGDDKEPENIA